jgi:hypothetical protein
VHEIAFAQWERCSRALEDSRRLVEPSRWLELRLEDLVARPEESLTLVCRAAEIPSSQSLERRLRELLASPANALSAPGAEKWRSENRKEIESLLPRIAATAAGSGYVIEAEARST